MKVKAIATTALMASVALTPLSPLSAPALADGKDFIAGALIGGIIGSAVTNENNKKKSAQSTKSATKSTKPTMSAAQREANREVQTALNYFGYPVGTPDGAIGPKSRAAIREYQAFIGYPATGELSEHERTILVTSYHRAVAGGPVIASAVAGSVYGLKAVLIAQRDEMAGVPGQPLPGSGAAATLATLPALVSEAPEVATAPEPEPEVMAATAEAPALPSFMNPAGAKGSLAAECNAISLTTAANGGMTTTDGMQDASFALGEQFCLARSYAMARGSELTAQIAGFTPAQIAEQCAAFGPVLKDHVAALSLKPADAVLSGVEGFILSSGMSPAQLSGTAKVCLGVGYAQDDMNVAIGSSLLLVAMGERGYAEYPGHHLARGFGATERPDLAMDWYQISLDAMGQGQMVVAPGLPGRDSLIRKAAYTINGRAAELVPEAKVQEAALPLFDVAPAPEAVAPAESAPVEIVEAVPVVVPEPELIEESVAVVMADQQPGAQDTSMVNAGAQAAIMAARLPFLIFSSF